MKFRLSFKTPDVFDCVMFACSDSELDVELEEQLTLRDQCHMLAKKFVYYGECIDIEFDTELNTATVVPIV